jgi:hypothetical protein
MEGIKNTSELYWTVGDIFWKCQLLMTGRKSIIKTY